VPGRALLRFRPTEVLNDIKEFKFMGARIFIVLIFFVSCESNQIKSEDIKPKLPTQEEMMPTFVDDYIKEKLPGWKLISESQQPNSTTKGSKNDSSEINYVLADINCDNIVDFTGFLQDSTENVVVYQIRSFKQYYVGGELETLEKNKTLDFSLRYMDFNTPFIRYDGSIEYFKCGAIERFSLQNKARKIFYANKEGFFVITVGQ
jgi:hypothetical protein